MAGQRIRQKLNTKLCLKSSMQLAQLNNELLKLQMPKNLDRQLNTFKIAQIRKKLEQFQQKKPNAQIKMQVQQLEINGKIIAQKVTQFFHSSILRTARIDNFNILIESKKSSKHVVLDFRNYTIQLQQKQNPLKKSQFQHFQWIEGKRQRFLVYAQGQRSYCLYTQGKSENQKILEYIRTKSLKPKDTRFINSLNMNFQHKVENLLACSKNEKKQEKDYESQWSPINRKTQVKQENSFQLNLTEMKGKSQEELNFNSLSRVQSQSSGSIFSPSSKPKFGHSTIFRLKGKRGIVNYQQLQQPIDLSKSPVKTPQINISDLRIGIQQVAVSDQENRNQLQDDLTQFVLQKDQSNKKRFSPKQQQEQSEENERQLNSQQEIAQLQAQYRTKVSSPKNKKGYRNQNVIRQVQAQHQHQAQKLRDDIEKTVNLGIGQVCCFSSCQLEQFTLVFKQIIQPQYQCAHQHKQLCCRQQIKFKRVKGMNPNSLNTVNYNRLANPTKVSRDINQLIQILFKQKTQNKQNYQQKQQISQNQAAKPYYSYYKNVFRSQQNVLRNFKVAKQSNNFTISIKTAIQTSQIPIKLQLDSMYQVNKSICFTLINCPQKFKSIWEKMGTIEFIKKYLTQKNEDYHFKHQFIAQQSANYEISQQWQDKIIKKVLNSNDVKAFQKMLYKGMNASLEKKIRKSIEKQGKQIELNFRFKFQQLKKYQYHILQNSARELRSNIQAVDVIKAALETQMNRSFSKRLDQLKLFFIYKYGTIKDLGLIFAKVIIRKVMPLIILCSRIQQIRTVFQIYFQVQYEIDLIFMEIYKYVKR